MDYAANSPGYRRTSRALVLVPLLMLVASLMGCSDLLTAAAADPTLTATAAVDAVNVAEAVLPDMPTSFISCIEKKILPGSSADQKVQNLQAAATSRQSCARALIAWYKNLQKAKKTASAKTAKTVAAAAAPAKK